MSTPDLPERASLDYLKKLAKERLRALRAATPTARLADAQREVAHDHGFPNWQALKAEVDRRRAPAVAAFFAACDRGDAIRLRDLLAQDASLIREWTTDGGSPLHRAIDHPEAVRVLLEHGADPNARDHGDNATPLHFAAGIGTLETVRLLVDAGADVHGAGDVHKGGIIGWAAGTPGNQAVIDLLLAHGARHHIFSALALNDHDLVQRLVEENPDRLSHRRSRFENLQTPLHAALTPPDGLGSPAPQYAMLQLLLDLGADVEAKDDQGRTPLAIAMLRGDLDATRMLKAAGAREPEATSHDKAGASSEQAAMAALGPSIKGFAVVLTAPKMAETIAWYVSIGFTVMSTHEQDGELDYVTLTFGRVFLHVNRFGEPVPVEVWLYTDRLDELYRQLKERQLRAMRLAETDAAALATGIRFTQDLWAPFYGGRQFSIEDPNGVSLMFYEPGEPRTDD